MSYSCLAHHFCYTLRMIKITLINYILLLLAAIIYAYYLRFKILKETKVDGSLTKSELVSVLITLIINPVICGTIYYISFYKKLPKKVKSINKYATIIFIVYIILQYGLHFSLFSATR